MVAKKSSKITINMISLLANTILCILVSKETILDVVLVAFMIMLMFYSVIVKMEKPEYLLYQLTIIGISCLVTTNLLQMFLALEIINFVSITLIPIYMYSLYSLESSLKYFLISAISAAMFILGSAIIYAETTSLDLYFISSMSANLAPLGPLLLIISLFIKLGIAPFHAWLPDAYEGSNYKTFIFISLYPKLFFLIVLFLVWKCVNMPNFILYTVIIACGMFGGIQAIFQQKIKRFLSFTMILNNIFLIVPLFATNIYFLIITFGLYFINNILTLFVFLENTFKNVREIISLDKLPALIVAFSLFSALGVPPLLGFFTKAVPFFLLIEKNIPLLIITVIFAVLASFYYLRLISFMFFHPKVKYNLPTISTPLAFSISFISYLLFAMILIFFI
jgi:NADH-quinone oxidoreductase subunit N